MIIITVDDEKEYSNVYAIPANYTDSGKLFGGMLETRNSIEAVIILIAIGYPELRLSVSLTLKFVIMTITLLPLGVISLMGINGDSLGQYTWHMICYWIRRRRLHFRRIGYQDASNKKKKSTKKNSRVRTRFHPDKRYQKWDHRNR